MPGNYTGASSEQWGALQDRTGPVCEKQGGTEMTTEKAMALGYT